MIPEEDYFQLKVFLDLIVVIVFVPHKWFEAILIVDLNMLDAID
jgi:hypothetical protein